MLRTLIIMSASSNTKNLISKEFRGVVWPRINTTGRYNACRQPCCVCGTESFMTSCLRMMPPFGALARYGPDLIETVNEKNDRRWRRLASIIPDEPDLYLLP
jgi:hypothetical protein